MKYLLLTALYLIAVSMQAQKTYLFVGSYTANANQGIYIYEFNNSTGETRLLSTTPTDNPSYLNLSPDRKYVYAVNERGNNKGGLSAFLFNRKTSLLAPINKVASMGDDPCYIDIDKKGKIVVVANYSGGNLSVFRTLKNGLLSPALQTIQHTGAGPNISRQDKAHVHTTMFTPDNNYVAVADLGSDRVMTYKVNANKKEILEAYDSFAIKAGSGPRHIAFHPNAKWMYVIGELIGNITALKYHAGKMEYLQTISLLPEKFKGDVGAADIHISPDGKFLYASNRGTANDISIFSINQINGKLNIIGHQPVLGKGPRNFVISSAGDYLLVANQLTDNIIVFNRDAKSGLLTDTGKRIQVHAPVCLKFAR
ncbi:MAG: 3-carboxymuconate cyclase [Chitinophagaceae bacterium]|nr:3-carboxymuconate cyclase [Chitinophagaceae bacterium]